MTLLSKLLLLLFLSSFVVAQNDAQTQLLLAAGVCRALLPADPDVACTCGGAFVCDQSNAVTVMDYSTSAVRGTISTRIGQLTSLVRIEISGANRGATTNGKIAQCARESHLCLCGSARHVAERNGAADAAAHARHFRSELASRLASERVCAAIQHGVFVSVTEQFVRPVS